MTTNAIDSLTRADDDLVELFEDFFAREVTPAVVEEVERTGELPTALWDRAEALQIPWIGIAEGNGGVGGTLADVVALLHHASYRATPLPLLEHHLAAALLARCDVQKAGGPLTVAGILPDETIPVVRDGVLSGRIDQVPWAGDVAAVAVLTRDEAGRDIVAVVRRADLRVEAARDLAGMPAPTVYLDSAPAQVAEIADVEAFRRYAEVLRCAAVSGLLRRLFDITSGYVSERHQFGKPVGAFQAVQIHVVTLAQAASMAMLSVDRAAGAVALGAGGLEVAATTAVLGQQVTLATAAAHQAHGAIGMTREYPLQQVTRRVHAISQRGGSLSATEQTLGRAALGASSVSELVARHPEEGIPSA